MPDNSESQPTQAALSPTTRRSRVRIAVVGGIAAAALAGGSIIAVSSASAAPAAGSAFQAAVAVTTSGTSTSGTATPKSTAPTPTRPVRQPHLEGAVTSVSGSTILIKDRDGFTRTIKVTSATKYADGLTAAIPVGTEIVATGAVDANGTTLDATDIGKAHQRGPGGPGGPGWGGPGPGWGPGGRGPGGHRPGDGWGPGQGSGSSTASAAPTTAPTTS